MPQPHVLCPAAQFNGTDRIGAHVKRALASNDFKKLRMAMAYAKSGGVARLYPSLEAWRTRGGTSSLIVGIDQKGTSIQALELAMKVFDDVWIAHAGGGSTFHPKFMIFSGPTLGRFIVGSHNLTTGGLETNLEAGVAIDYALPAEAAEFAHLDQMWDAIGTLGITQKLDSVLLEALLDEGSLFDEKSGAKDLWVGSKITTGKGKLLFPRKNPAPPSALPPDLVSLQAKSKASGGATKKKAPPAAVGGVSVAPKVVQPVSLVIQIKPHANGETFLSKIAINQNPQFFGYPFTGWTVPKRASAPYPQRFPDPLVEVDIFDARGEHVFHRANYPLNTIFYTRNAEIRVTISPDIREHIAPYSILHMQAGRGPHDYYFEIYNPGSKRYDELLAVCDQTMPGGGQTPRKMGWL